MQVYIQIRTFVGRSKVEFEILSTRAYGVPVAELVASSILSWYMSTRMSIMLVTHVHPGVIEFSSCRGQ